MSPGPSSSPAAHRRPGRRPLGRVVVGAVALVTVVALTATGSSGSASAASASTATAGTTSRDVLANLFEWNWPSVGRECTNVLGPAGYGGVQVAPPQDSVKRTELGNGSDRSSTPGGRSTNRSTTG